MEERDAVIVGARCAGATLAIELARRDRDVLMVDRDTFPSDTVSTHFFYPNTLSRCAQLGILDTLRSSHRLPSLAWRVIGMGHETFSRQVDPSRVPSKERLARWFSAEPE